MSKRSYIPLIISENYQVDAIPIIHAHNSSNNNPYYLPSYPTKLDRKLKFHSELSKDNYIKWSKLTPNINHQLLIQFPAIEWRKLVQSLNQKTEVLQWQAWLTGKFKLKTETSIRITTAGLSTYWIDDIGPIAADQYGNRPFPYIVTLSAGLHYIRSLVRAKHQTQIQFYITSLISNKISVSVTNTFIPDIIDGTLASNLIGVTIQNLSPTDQIMLKKVEIINELDSEAFAVDAAQDWSWIYPNQITILPVNIAYTDKLLAKCQAKSQLAIKLKLIFIYESSSEKILLQRLDFRCRKKGQSFEFTFMDIDGSIQYAAAIHPLSLTGSKLPTYPVLLNLHGTSVTASNSADSYKYKENAEQEDYYFGIENMWVLAPTRHGAHNWEGIGKNTAMAALNALIEFSKMKTVYPIDDTRVIFAGHSMGGHGAWLLGVSYPDSAIAVIPQAGWFKKEYYGDSNTFFLFDLQNAYIQSSLKSILEDTIQENAVELQVSNLKNVPVFVRVGGDDQVVHAWWSKRVIRLLHELYPVQNVNNPLIKYHEIKGKEHWWWDSIKPNDGGVVNDEEMRGYFKDILSQRTESVSCQDGYQFELTVYNPASVSSKHGIKVLQTWKSFQKATITVSVSVDNDRNGNACFCRINTINARRIEIDRSRFICNILRIDGVQFEFNDKDSIMICSESKNENKWNKCKDSMDYALIERSPISYGPIRQVFERKFRIVYGTKGGDDMKLKYKQWAIYLTNLWYMTGDNGNIRIHSDEQENIDLDHGENILLIGDTQTNEWSKRLLEEDKTQNLIDFAINDEYLRIGPCVFKDSVGFMAMFPIIRDGTNLHLGVMIGGMDMYRIHDMILMAKPTIPPMTRQPYSNTIPDYIVTDKHAFEKGYGSVLTAGFWRFDWKWDETTSFMSVNCQHDNINEYDYKREL